MSWDHIIVGSRSFPIPVVLHSAWPHGHEAERFLLSDAELARASGAETGGDDLVGTATLGPVEPHRRIVLEVESRAHLQRVRPVVESCLALLDLRPGWDSYGAKSLDLDLVESGLALIVALLKQPNPAPTVVPTSGGSIQLEWHLPGKDLEIEVVGVHRYSFIYEDENTGDSAEGEVVGDIEPLLDRVSKLSG